MASNHIRNTAAMLSSQRCSALTKLELRCRSPAITGTTLCRMHSRESYGFTNAELAALRRNLATLRSCEYEGARRLVSGIEKALGATVQNGQS